MTMSRWKLLVGWLVLLGAPASAPAQVRIITTAGGTYPVVAPDGASVLFSSGIGEDLDLYRMNLTTGVSEKLTSGPEEDSAARWSPDGTRVVFQRQDSTGNRDLWQLDLLRNELHNLTNTPDCAEQHPGYSSDGAAVIFDSNCALAQGSEGGADNYEIHLMTIADRHITRLTDWADWDMYGSLNPRGTHLAWRRALRDTLTGDRNFEILVMELATGGVVNVSRHASHDTSPAWSPDGQWLVFVSVRHGASDLHLVRPDGAALRRLTVSTPGRPGYERPTFASDSTVVASRRNGAGYEIAVITFTTEVEEAVNPALQ